MPQTQKNTLTSAHRRLLQEATAVAANAYAPYSRFRVGAALLLEDGSTVTGCNVENASYSLTICAERAALARAVSERGPSIRVQTVAVANLNQAASPPCGACRQALAEFAAPGALVLFPSADGTQMVLLSDLLPHGFALETRPQP